MLQIIKQKNKFFTIFFLILLLVFFYAPNIENAYSQSSGTEKSTTEQKGVVSEFLNATDACDFWKKFFDFAIKIIAPLSLIVLGIGGIFYLVSFGSTEKQATAKKIMAGSISGLIVGMASWGLFKVISPNLLICKIEVPQLELAESIEPTKTSSGSYSCAPCVGITPTYNSKEECQAKTICKGDTEENTCAGPSYYGGKASWCCKATKKMGILVVHWTAGRTSQNVDFSSRSSGRQVGYHYVVTGDGMIHAHGDDTKNPPWHTSNANCNSLAISAAGMYMSQSYMASQGRKCWDQTKPLGSACPNGFTPPQYAALVFKVNERRTAYSISNVMTHAQAAINGNYHCIKSKNKDPNVESRTSCRWDWDDIYF